MKRTLIYAMAAAMFAAGAVVTTPKAHAAANNYLWFPEPDVSSHNSATLVEAVEVALAIVH